MPTDYTLMDATLEILLMLLAAFLLGWLFCWLMKKIFGQKPSATYQPTNTSPNKPTLKGKDRPVHTSPNKDSTYNLGADLDLILDTPDTSKQQINLNEVDLPNKPIIEAPTIEVRQGVAQSLEHIDPSFDTNIDKSETVKSKPRIDLPDFNAPDMSIKGKIDSGVDAGKATILKGLGLGVAGIGAVAVGASSFKDKATDKVKNLDLNIDTPDITISTPEPTPVDRNIILSNHETPDFEAEIDLPEIHETDTNTEIDLIAAPSLDIDTQAINTDGIDLDTQPLSTSLQDTDQLDVKLASANTLETGKRKLGAGLSAATAGLGAVAAGAASLKDSTSEKIDNLSDKLIRPDLPTSLETNEANHIETAHSKPEADDLTLISGIDQQVASTLNAKGIHRYQDLQATNRTQLKQYLDETNNVNLHEIEPASWPHQATLCASRNWTKLSEYQSFLSGSNLGTRQTVPTYNVVDGDDLKKVEGIGPFFESLLNDAGITTYEHLRNAERDTLKEIIDAAGPDYRMHEPETWPYQAGLAHRGEWKKLQDYINFMTGRG